MRNLWLGPLSVSYCCYTELFTLSHSTIFTDVSLIKPQDSFSPLIATILNWMSGNAWISARSIPPDCMDIIKLTRYLCSWIRCDWQWWGWIIPMGRPCRTWRCPVPCSCPLGTPRRSGWAAWSNLWNIQLGDRTGSENSLKQRTFNERQIFLFFFYFFFIFLKFNWWLLVTPSRFLACWLNYSNRRYWRPF